MASNSLKLSLSPENSAWRRVRSRLPPPPHRAISPLRSAASSLAPTECLDRAAGVKPGALKTRFQVLSVKSAFHTELKFVPRAATGLFGRNPDKPAV